MMTIIMSHIDHKAFGVINAGCWDIFLVIVLEGILLQMRNLAVVVMILQIRDMAVEGI